MLRFVDRDLRRLMEIAERVCVRSGSRARAGAGNGGGGGGEEEGGGFEIMANVVWAEIGRAIMDELGSVVFAAGKPDDFRKVRFRSRSHWRHEEAEWIRAFAAPRNDAGVHPRARVPRAVRARDRAHARAPGVRAVRAALAAARLFPAAVEGDRRQAGGGPRYDAPGADAEYVSSEVVRADECAHLWCVCVGVKPFATIQGAAVWDAIETCWSAPVYIPELSHRFWKLTLQVRVLLLTERACKLTRSASCSADTRRGCRAAFLRSRRRLR